MDLKRIQHGVISISTEVAAFIQYECENFDRSRIEEKGSFNNLVSYVDKEAEKKIQLELANAREEGLKHVANAEKRGQSIVEEAKNAASAEAARIIAAAQAEAANQVTKAREELRDQVAALAVKGAEQILKREVNASAHADLLNQLKTEL